MITEVMTRNGPLRLCADNYLEDYRAATLLTKEPETAAWIEAFRSDDVFYDVGANIGVYTLYAAKLFPELAVMSFEPFHRNFHHLVENVLQNRFTRVTPVHVALSDVSERTLLHLPDTRYGGSGGQIGVAVNEHGQAFAPAASVPVLSLRLDDLIRLCGLPAPTAVKIDVDGAEVRIISGMGDTLSNSSLRTLLVEVNSAQQGTVIDGVLARHGFARDSEINGLATHSRHRRRETPGNTAENVVYVR